MAVLLPMTAHGDPSKDTLQRLELNLGAGITLATTSGSELDDSNIEYSYKTGFSFTSSISYRFTRLLLVQAGANLAAKGYNSETGLASSSASFYIAYLESPISLRADVPLTKKLSSYINIGVAPAVLLDADVTTGDGRFFEANRVVEKFDLGIVAGVGSALNVGDNIGAITLNVRYNYGLLNWDKSATGNNDGTLNRAIYVTVGYRADLATLGRLLGGRGDGKRPAEEAPRKPDPPPAAVESTPVPPSPAPGGPDS